jgi:hypothetical protein
MSGELFQLGSNLVDEIRFVLTFPLFLDHLHEGIY